ncbi:hypothetical protein DFH08DRAFT_972162 [Mycena albidolilacea]|uniref:Uncharacterized protein n=1 Tax=Mycena albidolilacea TaxID=1033008 RepID=A0AAD6ZCJ8_9AGAR|nr:hypothetical protein DFH08DRAFT_972162 [Mycena albidolilacea]
MMPAPFLLPPPLRWHLPVQPVLIVHVRCAVRPLCPSAARFPLPLRTPRPGTAPAFPQRLALLRRFRSPSGLHGLHTGGVRHFWRFFPPCHSTHAATAPGSCPVPVALGSCPVPWSPGPACGAPILECWLCPNPSAASAPRPPAQYFRRRCRRPTRFL